MADAVKDIVNAIQYHYLYWQAGDIVGNPEGLKPTTARRVYTNLEVADFDRDREPVLFPTNDGIRAFFTSRGSLVKLKSCPACRLTYDSEGNHVCRY